MVPAMGHSDLSAEDFVQRLLERNIKETVDAKSNPVSARLPLFCRYSFARLCSDSGIAYMHSPELGNRTRGGIKDHQSIARDWRKRLHHRCNILTG